LPAAIESFKPPVFDAHYKVLTNDGFTAETQLKDILLTGVMDRIEKSEDRKTFTDGLAAYGNATWDKAYDKGKQAVLEDPEAQNASTGKDYSKRHIALWSAFTSLAVGALIATVVWYAMHIKVNHYKNEFLALQAQSQQQQ
jgi:hypothetical protein